MYKRTTAALVCLTLLATGLTVPGPRIAYAESPSSALGITISPELGTIEESRAGSSKTIVYIQDAHDSLEAQENIAKIISQLTAQNQVRTVFEEGYEGEVPTGKYFGIIKNEKIREKISYYLLDKLRIGGAEYAHINRKTDFKLIGADSIKLQRENVEWYQKALKSRGQVEADLRGMENHLEILTRKLFPKELKTWMKLRRQYDEGQLDLLRYLMRISVLRKTRSLQLYPIIQLFFEAEQTKDARRIKELEKIKSLDIFLEIERFEKEIAQSYLTQTKEQEIFRYLHVLQLLKRLNRAEVSAAEYQAVRREIESFDTKTMAAFLAQKTGKSLVLSKRWETAIQNAVEFYETAHKRDLAIEKTISSFTENAAVLVFGGFHRENIKDILRRQNFSYLIVSPKITHISKKHQTRYAHLMEAGMDRWKNLSVMSLATRVLSDIYLAEETGAALVLNAEIQSLDRIAEALDPSLSREDMLHAMELAENTQRSESRGARLRSEDKKRPIEEAVARLVAKGTKPTVDQVASEAHLTLAQVRSLPRTYLAGAGVFLRPVRNRLNGRLRKDARLEKIREAVAALGPYESANVETLMAKTNLSRQQIYTVGRQNLTAAGVILAAPIADVPEEHISLDEKIRRITTAVETFKKQGNQKPSVEEVAAVSGMSRDQLYRIGTAKLKELGFNIKLKKSERLEKIKEAVRALKEKTVKPTVEAVMTESGLTRDQIYHISRKELEELGVEFADGTDRIAEAQATRKTAASKITTAPAEAVSFEPAAQSASETDPESDEALSPRELRIQELMQHPVKKAVRVFAERTQDFPSVHVIRPSATRIHSVAYYRENGGVGVLLSKVSSEILELPEPILWKEEEVTVNALPERRFYIYSGAAGMPQPPVIKVKEKGKKILSEFDLRRQSKSFRSESRAKTTQELFSKRFPGRTWLHGIDLGNEYPQKPNFAGELSQVLSGMLAPIHMVAFKDWTTPALYTGNFKTGEDPTELKQWKDQKGILDPELKGRYDFVTINAPSGEVLDYLKEAQWLLHENGVVFLRFHSQNERQGRIWIEREAPNFGWSVEEVIFSPNDYPASRDVSAHTPIFILSSNNQARIKSTVELIRTELIDLQKQAREGDPDEKRDALKRITQYFSHDNQSVREMVFKALKGIPGVQKGLLEFIHADAEIAKGVMTTLGFLGTLPEYRKDQDSMEAVTEALGKILEETKIEDPDAHRIKVRAALNALGYINTPEAASLLLQFFETNEDESLRAAKLHALAMVKTPSIIGKVIKAAHFETLISPALIPFEMSFLINGVYVSEHLASQQGQMLAERFGYIDVKVSGLLQGSESERWTAPAQVLIREIGIVTEPLLKKYEAADESGRADLLHEWKNRQFQFMNALLPEEIGMRQLVPVSVEDAEEGKIDRDVLFGALRESDWVNNEDKKATNPFGYDFKEKYAGRFFYISHAYFEKLWGEKIARGRKLLADEPAELTAQLLGYYMMDSMAAETEVREEPRRQAEVLVMTRWKAVSGLMQIKDHPFFSSADFGKRTFEDFVKAFAANRGFWKYPFLDLERVRRTNRFMVKAQSSVSWSKLSFGSRSALKLLAYDLLENKPESEDEVMRKWLEAFERLKAEEELVRAGTLPSIGIEIQSVSVPLQNTYLWKHALAYFDIPSPERLRYDHIVETAFKPSWTPSAFLLAVPILHKMGLHANYSKSSALHISLSGDLGEDAKWLAFPLTAFNQGEAKDYTETERAARAAWVMSKGLVHQNGQNQKVDFESEAPKWHTEIRTAHLENTEGTQELSPNFEKFLPAVYWLGAALAVQQKALRDETLTGEEIRASILWGEYRQKMQEIVSAVPEAEAYLREDWFQSTGDSKDPQLVMELPIFKRGGELREKLKQNPALEAQMEAQIQSLFLDYGRQVQQAFSNRSEVRLAMILGAIKWGSPEFYALAALLGVMFVYLGARIFYMSSFYDEFEAWLKERKQAADRKAKQDAAAQRRNDRKIERDRQRAEAPVRTAPAPKPKPSAEPIVIPEPETHEESLTPEPEVPIDKVEAASADFKHEYDKYVGPSQRTVLRKITSANIDAEHPKFQSAIAAFIELLKKRYEMNAEEAALFSQIALSSEKIEHAKQLIWEHRAEIQAGEEKARELKVKKVYFRFVHQFLVDLKQAEVKRYTEDIGVEDAAQIFTQKAQEEMLKQQQDNQLLETDLPPFQKAIEAAGNSLIEDLEFFGTELAKAREEAEAIRVVSERQAMVFEESKDTLAELLWQSALKWVVDDEAGPIMKKFEEASENQPAEVVGRLADEALQKFDAKSALFLRGAGADLEPGVTDFEEDLERTLNEFVGDALNPAGIAEYPEPGPRLVREAMASAEAFLRETAARIKTELRERVADMPAQAVTKAREDLSSELQASYQEVWESEAPLRAQNERLVTVRQSIERLRPILAAELKRGGKIDRAKDPRIQNLYQAVRDKDRFTDDDRKVVSSEVGRMLTEVEVQEKERRKNTVKPERVQRLLVVTEAPVNELADTVKRATMRRDAKKFSDGEKFAQAAEIYLELARYTGEQQKFRIGLYGDAVTNLRMAGEFEKALAVAEEGLTVFPASESLTLHRLSVKFYQAQHWLYTGEEAKAFEQFQTIFIPLSEIRRQKSYDKEAAKIFLGTLIYVETDSRNVLTAIRIAENELFGAPQAFLRAWANEEQRRRNAAALQDASVEQLKNPNELQKGLMQLILATADVSIEAEDFLTRAQILLSDLEASRKDLEPAFAARIAEGIGVALSRRPEVRSVASYSFTIERIQRIQSPQAEPETEEGGEAARSEVRDMDPEKKAVNNSLEVLKNILTKKILYEAIDDKDGMRAKAYSDMVRTQTSLKKLYDIFNYLWKNGFLDRPKAQGPYYLSDFSKKLAELLKENQEQTLPQVIIKQLLAQFETQDADKQARTIRQLKYWSRLFPEDSPEIDEMLERRERELVMAKVQDLRTKYEQSTILAQRFKIIQEAAELVKTHPRLDRELREYILEQEDLIFDEMAQARLTAALAEPNDQNAMTSLIEVRNFVQTHTLVEPITRFRILNEIENQISIRSRRRFGSTDERYYSAKEINWLMELQGYKQLRDKWNGVSQQQLDGRDPETVLPDFIRAKTVRNMVNRTIRQLRPVTTVRGQTVSADVLLIGVIAIGSLFLNGLGWISGALLILELILLVRLLHHLVTADRTDTQYVPHDTTEQVEGPATIGSPGYVAQEQLGTLTGLLLKYRNYRDAFEKWPLSKKIMERLRAAGVNEFWDDAGYRIQYVTEGNDFIQNPIPTHREAVRKAMEEFIGTRNETNGEYEEGPLTGSLKKGAKSGRQILARYSDIFTKIREDNVSLDESIYLLNEIKLHFVKKGTRGEEALKGYLDSLSNDYSLTSGVVEVTVWDRDPWIDLSSQGEFYCCAFLDGMFQTGVYGYMLSKGVSMLDFAIGEGRKVRAIMAAGIYKDAQGNDAGVLVIDSVEGTMSVDPAVIKRGIEEYAFKAGFKKVLYNSETHNATPKKFINFVRSEGAKQETIEVTRADDESLQYLEAFPSHSRGYRQPKGRVSGYATNLTRARYRFVSWKLEDIKVEAVAAADWDAVKSDILALEATFPANLQESEEMLARKFRNPDSSAFVAKINGEIVGYALGGKLENYGSVQGNNQDENFGRQNTFYLASLAMASSLNGKARKHFRDAVIAKAKEKGFLFFSAHVNQKQVEQLEEPVILGTYPNWFRTRETYQHVRLTLQAAPPVAAPAPETPAEQPAAAQPAVEITEPQVSDWPEIKDTIRMLESVFESNLRYTSEMLRQGFTDPEKVRLIAKLNGRIVGYVLAGPLESFRNLPGATEDENWGQRNTVYSESMVVDPTVQGQGIGTKLQKKLDETIVARGFKYKTAHRREGIAAKVGATVLSRHTNWSGTGKTYEYSRTDLSNPARSEVRGLDHPIDFVRNAFYEDTPITEESKLHYVLLIPGLPKNVEFSESKWPLFGNDFDVKPGHQVLFFRNDGILMLRYFIDGESKALIRLIYTPDLDQVSVQSGMVDKSLIPAAELAQYSDYESPVFGVWMDRYAVPFIKSFEIGRVQFMRGSASDKDLARMQFTEPSPHMWIRDLREARSESRQTGELNGTLPREFRFQTVDVLTHADLAEVFSHLIVSDRNRLQLTADSGKVSNSHAFASYRAPGELAAFRGESLAFVRAEMNAPYRVRLNDNILTVKSAYKGWWRNLPAFRSRMAQGISKAESDYKTVLKRAGKLDEFISIFTQRYQAHYGMLKRVWADFGVPERSSQRVLNMLKSVGVKYEKIPLTQGDLLKGLGSGRTKGQVLKELNQRNWNLREFQIHYFGSDLYSYQQLIEGLGIVDEFTAKVRETYGYYHGVVAALSRHFGISDPKFEELIETFDILVEDIPFKRGNLLPALGMDRAQALALAAKTDWNLPKMLAEIRAIQPELPRLTFKKMIQGLDLEKEFRLKVLELFKGYGGIAKSVAKRLGIQDESLPELIARQTVQIANLKYPEGHFLPMLGISKEEMIKIAENKGWILQDIVKHLREIHPPFPTVPYVPLVKGLGIQSEYAAKVAELYQAYGGRVSAVRRLLGLDNQSFVDLDNAFSFDLPEISGEDGYLLKIPGLTKEKAIAVMEQKKWDIPAAQTRFRDLYPHFPTLVPVDLITALGIHQEFKTIYEERFDRYKYLTPTMRSFGISHAGTINRLTEELDLSTFPAARSESRHNNSKLRTEKTFTRKVMWELLIQYKGRLEIWIDKTIEENPKDPERIVLQGEIGTVKLVSQLIRRNFPYYRITHVDGTNKMTKMVLESTIEHAAPPPPRRNKRASQFVKRSEARLIENMTAPVGIFMDARELVQLNAQQADKQLDELLIFLERHPAFDIYIDGTDRYPVQNIQIPKLQKLLDEHSDRVHLSMHDRAGLNKKQILIQVSFFKGAGTAEETQKGIQNLKEKYQIASDILPLEYAQSGALKAFLDLIESKTASLLKQLSDEYASLGANGRWIIAQDYLAALDNSLRASYVIQWSA